MSVDCSLVYEWVWAWGWGWNDQVLFIYNITNVCRNPVISQVCERVVSLCGHVKCIVPVL